MHTSCLFNELHEFEFGTDVIVSVLLSLMNCKTLVSLSTNEVYYLLTFIGYYTLTGSPHI